MKKLLLLVVLCLGLTGCGASGESDTTDKTDTPDVSDKPAEEVRVFEHDEADEEKILEMKLEYKGKSRTGIFTVQDLIDFGFTYEDAEDGDRIIKGDYFASGGFHVFFKEDRVLLNAWNTTSEDTPLSKCLVTRVNIAQKGFSVNGITIGEDTYDTVISKFGRDGKDRGNSFEEETTLNSGDISNKYYAQFKFDSSIKDYPSVGNRRLRNVTITTYFDDEGVVKSIDLSVGTDKKG